MKKIKNIVALLTILTTGGITGQAWGMNDDIFDFHTFMGGIKISGQLEEKYSYYNLQNIEEKAANYDMVVVLLPTIYPCNNLQTAWDALNKADSCWKPERFFVKHVGNVIQIGILKSKKTVTEQEIRTTANSKLLGTIQNETIEIRVAEDNQEELISIVGYKYEKIINSTFKDGIQLSEPYTNANDANKALKDGSFLVIKNEVNVVTAQ